MHIPIQLKFEASLSGPKTNICTNFSANLFNIHGVIRYFMHKAKWNFCHAHRVSHLLKKDENQH